MTVIGLDLSLQKSGLACIPDDWALGHNGIVVTAVATKKAKFKCDGERLSHIAVEIGKFCKANGATHVYVEDVYFGFTAKPLLRLRGAVEREVWRVCKLPIIPVSATSARKHLLGQSGGGRELAKKMVFETLRSAGVKVANDDEADAVCIANFARNDLGLWSLAAPSAA